MPGSDLTVLKWTKVKEGYELDCYPISCTIIRHKETKSWGYSVCIWWQGKVHGDFYGEENTATEAKLACEHVLKYLEEATKKALGGVEDD